MNELAQAFWSRALTAFQVAESLLLRDANSSSSRAYYAAFYAVSALFALQDKKFSKHSAIEAAVHRDLVHTGVWPKERGSDFSFLRGTRNRGDYEVIEDVSEENAREALAAAQRILEAVHQEHPDLFPLTTEKS